MYKTPTAWQVYRIRAQKVQLRKNEPVSGTIYLVIKVDL